MRCFVPKTQEQKRIEARWRELRGDVMHYKMLHSYYLMELDFAEDEYNRHQFRQMIQHYVNKVREAGEILTRYEDEYNL